MHTRVVRSGFSQWFPDEQTQAPAWKMNMIVVMLLYPVVFLFGLWVGTPVLTKILALPFYLSLFLGNIVSVVLLSYLVPVVARGFGWWLSPNLRHATRNGWAGAALIIGLYLITLFIFSKT
jgi:antibiotic biosynthesis monooxygenase (ABM) superfamily enzyme